MGVDSKGNILVAEDDADFAAALCELLAGRGYRCQVAKNAPQAKQMLLDDAFDLLLSDLQMPGNEGLDLIQWLQDEIVGLPVVLLTGFPSLDTAIRSVELPIVAYLVKPPDFDKLLSVIDREVARHHAYIAFKSGESRFCASLRALSSLEAILQPDRPEASEELDRAIRELRSLVGVLEQMVACFRDLSIDNPSHPVPPRDFRLAAFESALQRTVFILEQTRGQFKSRELGRLRRHLERILGFDTAAPSPFRRSEEESP